MILSTMASLRHREDIPHNFPNRALLFNYIFQQAGGDCARTISECDSFDSAERMQDLLSQW
jgi:hypothetical protein